MNEFDQKFINTLNNIITNGTEYDSRAVWKDTGEKAKCKKIFGVVSRYNSDYSNTPPIGTLRKLSIKNCIDEILWIWQRKSNNIHDLNSHIWDSWADEYGSIGAAYGYQVATKLRRVTETIDHEDNFGMKYSETVPLFLDQTDYVLHELKYNPFSRKIITDLYSVGDVGLMGLDPCCYSCTWNVTEKDGKRYLNLLLNQRSQDMIVANNWNVFQYWVLQNLFAMECNLLPGELVHVICDCHIYDRHIPIAKDILGTYLHYLNQADIYAAPKVEFDFDGFYKFRVDDCHVSDYKPLMDIKNIPVAV